MRNAKSFSRLLLIYGVGLTVITVFFLNCQRAPQFEISNFESVPHDMARAPAQANVEVKFTSELQAASAPFAAGKFQRPSPHSQQGKMNGDLVAAGARIVLILDNECAARDGGAAPTRAAYDRRLHLPNLRTQTYVWVLHENTSHAVLATLIDQDPCVVGASHDAVAKASFILNDARIGEHNGLNAIGVGATYGFFNNPNIGSRAEVIVAVIDTGVVHTHEDMVGQMWREASTQAMGFNFIANNIHVYDDFGHGTKVAGVIAAKAHNGIGLAGVMGHDAKIMALKTHDSTGASLVSDIGRAIDYARAMNVPVINLSTEVRGHQPTLEAAINSAIVAGCVVVSAAGNAGIMITADDGSFVAPAGYSVGLAGAISVGSIDALTGMRSPFSNYSSTYVEIAAPGSNGILLLDKNGSYSKAEGTSFSAPMVSGAAALVISFFRKNQIPYTPALVESTIMTSALRNSNLSGHFTEGRTLDLRSLARHLQRTYLTPVDGGFDEN